MNAEGRMLDNELRTGQIKETENEGVGMSKSSVFFLPRRLVVLMHTLRRLGKKASLEAV